MYCSMAWTQEALTMLQRYRLPCRLAAYRTLSKPALSIAAQAMDGFGWAMLGCARIACKCWIVAPARAHVVATVIAK